jgi:hypothetical protein
VQQAAKATKDAPTQVRKQYSGSLPERVTAYATNICDNCQKTPYLGHQERYMEQRLQPEDDPVATTPTPWLLEDSALQELGLDMKGFDPNMQWEGVDEILYGEESRFSIGITWETQH